MKGFTQGLTAAIGGYNGALAADYNELLTITKELIALRNKIENKGFDESFIDGMCSEELKGISNKLDEILFNDFARPLSFFVVDSLALNITEA